jgi:hypothetical protein
MGVVLAWQKLPAFFFKDEKSTEEHDDKSYSGKQDDKPKIRVLGFGTFISRSRVFHASLDAFQADCVVTDGI